MAQKLGILGGTFNPIHYGHLAAAEEVRDRLRLDKVIFVPSAQPPHKRDEDIPSPVQRQEMVRLAVQGNPHFSVSSVEIARGGLSYTVDTIETLHREHPGRELFFITGLDSFLEIRTWKDWQRLLDQTVFVVLSREGCRFRDLEAFDFLHAPAEALERLDAGTQNEADLRSGGVRIILEVIPAYDISSTDIRKRVREHRSIKYHLPEPVERYIIENTLYG